MINLSSFIQFHATRSPDRTALSYQGRKISYAEFLRRIERTAAWLARQNVGPDDVVAVFLKNSAAFVEIAFATSHVGAIFLPINFRLARDEVTYIVANSGAKLLIADEEFKSMLGDGLLEDRTPLFYIDEPIQADSSKLAGAEVLDPAPIAARKPGDIFRLMYTSGTTDRPKGVIHTYDNFYWKSADHVIALQLGAHNRLLVAGPLYHVGAFDLPGIAVLWLGGMLHIHREFDVASVLKSIGEEDLNCAWLAPVMLTALLTFPQRAQYDVSGLRWVIAGGEKTPESRIREFSGYFTGGRFIDGYGLTESCSGDTLMEEGREIEKIGSTGRPLAHVEVRIADDSGRFLAAGEHGEVCLRGPKVTSGYWKDPQKTAAAFFGDWFRTGDVGYLDAEGFLYLTDRKKDMIISGGENIASSEVERVIYQLAQVKEAAVIGIPDERWGEVPVAIVSLMPDTKLDLETLMAHCRTQLAAFKVPKQLIIRDSLPRNPSGKVLKRVLRQAIAP